MEGALNEPDTQDDLKDKESKKVEEKEAKKDGKALLVLQESIPIVENKWLWKNIFHSTGIVHGHKCTVVIDGGSCENIIYHTLVGRLKIEIYKHNHPYFVKWLMIGDEVQVRHTCQVGDDP